MLGMILFLLSAHFFQNYFFQKIISGPLFECQMVKVHIRTAVLTLLILVQSVCKGYQQTTTKVAASKERVKYC